MDHHRCVWATRRIGEKMFIKRIKGCQANGKHKMADLGRLQSNLQGPGQEQWEIEQEAHA
jgi:hypothetical protein